MDESHREEVMARFKAGEDTYADADYGDFKLADFLTGPKGINQKAWWTISSYRAAEWHLVAMAQLLGIRCE
jgi:hypothetical protein